MKNVTQERLAALRSSMARAGVDAVIIPKTDPHQSEYLADHWHTIRWLSGFTGSAATMVVTAGQALFWTDSRYFLQAAEQLEGTGIELMKEGLPGTPTIDAYLQHALPEGSRVGIDGMLFSIEATRRLEQALGRTGIGLDVTFDPFPAIWHDRPALPPTPAFLHPIEYAGETAASKIARILQGVADQGADSTFICDLAEIAWTLNIRSRDVECNPVATAFLMVAAPRSTLFIDPAKLTPEVTASLDAEGVDTLPYSEAAAWLAALPSERRVLLSLTQAAGAFLTVLGDRAVVGTSPVALLKAVKNDVQIQGVRQAMVRDGVALVKSFMEIERRLSQGEPLSELDVAGILRGYRSQSPMYFDDSFATIAGYGPHGAIVHYEATEASSSDIKPEGLLLVDSGAQYLDGTTDITRTIALGAPTPRQKRDFTLVMKGHIALATAVYPEGTRGFQLDILARQYLYRDGLSYLHGTGHGVGHFLNVHEGPQSIRLNDTFAPLLPGMITSDEPGLYRDGQWGIRCENLVLTVEKETTPFGRFLTFEPLTLFPFDTTLLDTSLTTADELRWLDTYHAAVYDALSPHLDPAQRSWLRDKTKPVSSKPA